MLLPRRLVSFSLVASLAGPLCAGFSALQLRAQQYALPNTEASSIALPLAEDRGHAALEQTLRRLGTTASLLMIVAHPDDEDGALLTYLSRGLGVRCTLFTLTRGEGGQNAMGGDTDDALGLIRTNELLKADEYYGADQLWGTEADFGFSKTQEEAFARWTHERVLYDAVLAVRKTRPQIIVSTFAGGVTDGHGQHQVSGEIAQEAFKAAADPTIFPDQLKPLSEGGLGLEPWQPLAVYSMTPFAPVTDKGMFDYATGKWAPARFHNYVTNTWTDGTLSTDVTMHVGQRDPELGRSYLQIAREGWGMQKSQYGGANPVLAGPNDTNYHLWAVADDAKATGAAGGDSSLFRNAKVQIDTSIAGLARFAPADRNVADALRAIDTGLSKALAACPCGDSAALALSLAPLYKQALDLRSAVAGSALAPRAKASLVFELDQKIAQFQSALVNLLGLDLTAFRTRDERAQTGNFRGDTADETSRSVAPGEKFNVRLHATQASGGTRLSHVWLESYGTPWPNELVGSAPNPATPTADPIFRVQAADDAAPTEPYFSRPTIEQPYYDVSDPRLRDRSFAPWPLAAWAEFTYRGLPIRIGRVVQTLARVTGPGGIYEPLIVSPAIGVRVTPEAQILPLDGSPLPVRVVVHTQAAAEGTVTLKLPDGWHAEPAEAKFLRPAAGDAEPLSFAVTPAAGTHTGAFSIQAVAHSGGRDYTSGWQSVGYPGLRPYNLYTPAELRTRKVDVKLAGGLRIGYVMGTGDTVPEAIEGLGLPVHLLSASELASANLAQWNVIVVGIRAYSNRPELTAAQPRLNEFVRNGGTLIVQYQSATFAAPFPLALERRPENVVDEGTPVKLLAPGNPLLSSPNRITSTDFDGWVEERGHSFLSSWDAAYTPLTETADAGQAPQHGGLLVAHPGKGTYIYVAYALHRQLPELVPGAYRLLANLLSAGSVR